MQLTPFASPSASAGPSLCSVALLCSALKCCRVYVTVLCSYRRRATTSKTDTEFGRAITDLASKIAHETEKLAQLTKARDDQAAVCHAITDEMRELLNKSFV